MSSTAEPLRGQSLQASLTVKDLDQSLAWYVEMLGFTVRDLDGFKWTISKAAH